MATVREIVVYCDAPKHDGAHVDATPIVVSLNGGAPRQIDLCYECQTALVVPLASLLDTSGIDVEREHERQRRGTMLPASAVADRRCPVCNNVFQSAYNLRRHVTRQHGELITDHPCPDCDYYAATAQGLGAHRHFKHGYMSPKPLATARRAATKAKVDA